MFDCPRELAMIELPQSTDHEPIFVWQMRITDKACIEVGCAHISYKIVEEG